MKPLLTFFLALSLAFAAPAPPTLAQNPSEPEAAVAERPLRCGSKGAAANRALSAPRNLVPNGVNRLMAELDGFAAARILALVNAHHAEAERVLGHVALPEDMGNLRMIWEQRRNTDKWQDLLRGLADRAADELEPSRESTLEGLQGDLALALEEGLVAAQETIWRAYMETLEFHFPQIGVRPWYGSVDFSALPQMESIATAENGGVLTWRSDVGVFLAASRAAMWAWNQRLRIFGVKQGPVKLAVKKIAGIVARRAVNKVSWASRAGPAAVPVALLFVVWDLVELWRNTSDAKRDFEEDFRANYLSAYREIFTADAIWRGDGGGDEDSLRGELESFVRDALEFVDASYREEARRMVAPELVICMSPTASDYVSDQAREGRRENEIREDLLFVGGTFDDGLIASAPFETLLHMALAVPDADRGSLRELAGELGLPLVEEFERRGKDVLDATRSLGPRTFIEAFRSGGTVDWRAAAELFAQYPAALNERARRGLFLSAREGVGRSGVSTETLEEIARRESLFGQAAPLLRSDVDRLYRLFGDSDSLDVVERAFDRNPEVAGAFAAEWPVVVWRRYGDADRFDALWAVADDRFGERGQRPVEFAREIGERDALTPRFLDAGLCAVRIWDEHAPSPAGAHQQRMAESGVALLKKGYPCDELLTPEGLEQAKFYDEIPLIGKWAGKFMYNHLRKFPVIIELAFYGLVLIVVVWVGVRVYRILPLRGGRAVARRAAPVREVRAAEDLPAAPGGEGGEAPALDRPGAERLEDERPAEGRAIPPPGRNGR